MTREFRRRINLILAIFPLLMALAMVLTPVCVYAEPDQEAEDLEAQRVARMSLPIQSDDYEEWPAGPHIGAEAAIVWMQVRVLSCMRRILMSTSIRHR